LVPLLSALPSIAAADNPEPPSNRYPAYIARVVEDLTAAFDRRSGLLPPDFAPNTTAIPGFAVCHRIVFGLLGDVADDKRATPRAESRSIDV
jgi:hypothetical protein